MQGRRYDSSIDVLILHKIQTVVINVHGMWSASKDSGLLTLYAFSIVSAMNEHSAG